MKMIETWLIVKKLVTLESGVSNLTIATPSLMSHLTHLSPSEAKSRITTKNINFSSHTQTVTSKEVIIRMGNANFYSTANK